MMHVFTLRKEKKKKREKIEKKKKKGLYELASW